MKKTLNATLFLALFATISIAEDGNQGSGGRNCDPNVDPTCHPVANLGGYTGIDLIEETMIRGVLDVFELIP